MDAFQMLKDIIFMRTDICQLKSAMQKKVFYYSKTDSAKKLIVVEKMGNGRMHREREREIEYQKRWVGN